MNQHLVLLVGDHGLRAPRARNSVATILASSLPVWCLPPEPDRVLVLDRTVSAGSRAVLDLALECLVDLDRIRSRVDSADLYVSMNVADAHGAGCNPFDWVTRWLRIKTTARTMGWHPHLVWLAVGESAAKESRRFEKRVHRALEQVGETPIRIDEIEWRDATDPGSGGARRIAQAILEDLDLDSRRLRFAPSVVG